MGWQRCCCFFYQRRSEDLNLEAMAENSDSLDDYSLNLLAMYLKRDMGNIIQPQN